jgi:hypothetical protein
MRPRIYSKLVGLPRLDRKNALTQALPCKVCGALAPFFDVVDFNKSAGELDCYMFGPAGIPVIHYRCGDCGFLFTPFFDDWATDDFRRFVYNADYAAVDPEYAETRPERVAERIAAIASGLRDFRVLDYGSGSGVFARCMAEHGFSEVQEYDPFSHPTRPTGPFDIVLCTEVLEHSPRPLETLREMRSLLSEDGCIILGQCLQPSDIERIRCSWWYCAPRNGHCSMFEERTLSIIAEKLGLLFHSGGTLVFRPLQATKGSEIARRVGSHGPLLCVTLGASGIPDVENFHAVEKGSGRPFRWTAQRRLSWTVELTSDCPAMLQVRIPFAMEVERGFASNCSVAVGTQPASMTVLGTAIIAEAQDIEPGATTIALTTPELKSPAQLRGSVDSRRLGLALQVMNG